MAKIDIKVRALPEGFDKLSKAEQKATREAIRLANAQLSVETSSRRQELAAKKLVVAESKLAVGRQRVVAQTKAAENAIKKQEIASSKLVETSKRVALESQKTAVAKKNLETATFRASQASQRAALSQKKLAEQQSISALSGVKLANTTKQVANQTKRQEIAAERLELAQKKLVAQRERLNTANSRGGGLAKQIASNVGLMAIQFGAAALGARELARAVTDVFRVGGSFEAQLSKLEAVSGSTEGELARLSAQARNVGSTTSSSASEVASLQIELARLGFSAQEISEATPAVRDFAVALDAELGRSAEFAGAVVKSFNLTTQDTARILDVATAAANSSALNFDRLALGVPKAAKAAESAGLNFANLTALLGKLKDNGLDVETSGVGIRNILLKLNEVGSDTADILGSDVNSFQDLIQVLRVAKGDTNRLKEAQKEFGLRNAIVFKTLVDNVDGLQAYSDELENSQGLTKKTADIMEDNFQGAVKGLSSAFESLQISIFNLVKGPGEDLINFLTETTREWDNLLLRFDKTTQLSQKGLLPFVDNVKRLRVELDEASKAAKRTGEFNERLISSRLSTKLKVATKNLQEFVSKGLATQVQVDILLGDKTFKEAQKDIEAQAKKKAPGGAAATKPGLSEDEKKRRAKEKAERLKFEARAQNDLLSLKARSKENEFARDRALEEIRFKEKTKAALDLNASDAAIIKENNLIKSQIDAAEALKKIEDAKALSTILEENRIMALENRFDRERALEAARFNERIEMEETTAAQVIALEEQKAREIEKINVAEQFSIDRRAKFELKQKQKSALKNIELQNQVGQAGVNAAKFFAGENKKIAVSEAIIHGVVAVQKAWASAPPPANLPAVALAGTATALNVQTAKNAKFAVGGMVGGSGGGRSDSVNASLSRGEFVMPADVTRRRRGELENMRLGGSSTTNSNTINFSPTVNISSSGGSQDVDLFTGAMKTTLSELLQEMNQEGFALA